MDCFIKESAKVDASEDQRWGPGNICSPRERQGSTKILLIRLKLTYKNLIKDS